MLAMMRDAALVIVGHGSTVNPDSSEPTLRHADEIRSRGIFREVACCFWKEEPSMREVYDMLDSKVVYLVPNFISEGFFCQEVLPRELHVVPPMSEADGKLLRYCAPVGVHPNMTRLLLQRADEVAAGVPRAETSLVIVGHGTNLNDNSTKAIKDQVELIRTGGYGFAEVVDAYMEEAPLVAEWDKLTTAPNVVVVPFFIADGLHSYQDIPVLLGMAQDVGAAASESQVFKHNPNELRGRRLYYSGAIGTEPLMSDVILDQVAAFDEEHGITDVSSEAKIEAWLHQQLADGEFEIGQVLVRRSGAGAALCHVADADAADGKTYHGAIAAREIAWLDEAGAFRGLKSAPNLRRGWQLHLADVAELRLALDFIYPAAVGMAHQEAMAENWRATPLRDYLSRQTGMYRFCNGITDAQASEIVASVCDTGTRCLRRIAWGLTVDERLSGAAAAKYASPERPRRALSVICKHACPYLVGETRKVARSNFEVAQAAKAPEVTTAGH